jgi:hypothetical protein
MGEMRSHRQSLFTPFRGPYEDPGSVKCAGNLSGWVTTTAKSVTRRRGCPNLAQWCLNQTIVPNTHREKSFRRIRPSAKRSHSSGPSGIRLARLLSLNSRAGLGYRSPPRIDSLACCAKQASFVVLTTSTSFAPPLWNSVLWHWEITRARSERRRCRSCMSSATPPDRRFT